MQQVWPGIDVWSIPHPTIPMGMRSALLSNAQARVLIDPNEPPEGLSDLEGRGAVGAVIVTSPFHVRQSLQVSRSLGASLWVPQKGTLFPGSAEESYLGAAQVYGDNAHLPGGLRAIRLSEMPHGEAALHREGDGGLLVFADGLMRDPEGNLTILSVAVLSRLFGDEQAALSFHEANRKALNRLRGVKAEIALFAHGDPLVGGASSAIEQFIDGL
jgi:hypothetical protein